MTWQEKNYRSTLNDWISEQGCWHQRKTSSWHYELMNKKESRIYGRRLTMSVFSYSSIYKNCYNIFGGFAGSMVLHPLFWLWMQVWVCWIICNKHSASSSTRSENQEGCRTIYRNELWCGSKSGGSNLQLVEFVEEGQSGWRLDLFCSTIYLCRYLIKKGYFSFIVNLFHLYF